MAAVPAGAAQQPALHIPPAPLTAALAELARQTGITVGFAGALPAIRTRGLDGRMPAAEALRRLLRGTRLRAVEVGPSTFRLEPLPEPRPQPAPAAAPAPTVAPTGDIVVTATKRRETLLDLPLSASVVQPLALLPGQRDASGLIAVTEGAFATNLGPGRNRLFLRGVADSPFNGPTQSTVGLYLDDARISYATPDPDLKLVDIDRVEVLRGPQGTLYGTGSLGGVVRIVTRRPDLEGWSGMAAAEAAAIAHGSPGGGGEAMLNVPLVAGRLGLRASAYAERTGGWIDDAERLARDVNRVSRRGGRAALRFAPAEAWTIDAGLTAQWIDAGDAQYADGGRRLARRTAIAQPHDNDFLAANIGVEGHVGGAALTLTTAYVTHEVDSVFDASARPGAAQPTAYAEQRSMRLFSQEARLSGGSARRPWLIGLSYLNAVDALTGTFRATSDSVARDQQDANTELSLFGEATRPLTGALDLRLGLRLFRAREENERYTDPAERVRTREGATPSAALSWSPREDARLWLRYASAIRPGGLDPDPRGGTFAADELQSLEAGWRIALPGANLVLNGALFALRWENVQSDVIGSDGLVSTINAGVAHNAGIESGLQLGRGRLRAETGLTLQHARLQGGRWPDRRLPVIPDFTAHARLSRAVAVGGLEGEAVLSARYVGSTRLSFDPLLDREAGEYASVDGALSLGRGAWRATLTVANLFDSAADTFAFGNPFSVRAAVQRTPLQPRTLSIRFERRF